MSKTATPKFENVDYYHTIALNISHYRRCIGYTQAVLAEKVNLSTSYISQLESTNNIRSFSMETFFNIAILFWHLLNMSNQIHIKDCIFICIVSHFEVHIL